MASVGVVATETSAAPIHSVFHPSVWGDFFLTNLSQPDQTVLSGWNQQISVLKQDVKNMLSANSTDWEKNLRLIDVLERLGIGYLVDKEIDEQLRLIYHARPYSDDIRNVSLHFRLLRQHGYHVPCDVFNKLNEEELRGDIEGMLSLYEAGYLGVAGEDVLDEAIEFTKMGLRSAIDDDDDDELKKSPVGERVNHALKRPLRKGLEKHEQLFFISVYEQDPTHDPALLTLAKLCFNVVQVSYQKELRDLTKWWVELNLARKLPFARDRLVEVYFWAVGALWEPKYRLARMFLTKITMLISCLDDIYDVQGTIDELEPFTDAIIRWETRNNKEHDEVPEYMLQWLEGMRSVVDEMEETTTKQGRPHCGDYLRLGVKNQAKAYLSEARWLAQNVMPSVEEYRRVGLYSCGYPLMAISILCGMDGENAPQESFEWLLRDPRILVASSDICRLMDDVVSHEFEQERGHHVASLVECYMNQYGVGKPEALAAIDKMVGEDWKKINEELLANPLPTTRGVMSVFLGLARVIDVLYKESDGYTHSTTSTKQILTSMLLTPMII